MKNCLFSLLCFLVSLSTHSLTASSQSAGFSGSTTLTIDAGNSGTPKYYIANAGLSSDPIYTGFVAAVHDNNNSLTFLSEQNSTLDLNPPFVQGAFNKDILLPRITVSRSGDSVNSVTVDYLGSYTESRNGFVALPYPPQILIDAPDGNGDTAIITSSVDANGKLSAAPDPNIPGSGGSGYNTDPKATIVAGPHFIKITDTTSAHYGRVFLIQNSDTNNTISFGADLNNTQRLTHSEASSSPDIDDFFDVNMSIEIYPAQTLGSFFGLDIADLPTNWEHSDNKDDNNSNKSPTLVYFWNNDLWGFETYFFSTNYRPASYSAGGTNDTLSWGWKTRGRSKKIKNNRVIYPDESFIIANRGDAFSLESEGAIETANKQLFLPEYQNSAILNNPYGTDLMLAELIPSRAIGNGSTQFRPGTAAYDGEDGDMVTFLSGSTWSRFWYKDGNNTGVTRMHEIGVRRPLDSSGNDASTIDADDLYIGSGSVDAVESCTDATGTTLLSSGNDSNYTKVTISGGISDLKGFTITFEDINGRLLHDDNGSAEVSVTDPETQLTPGSGSVVFSNLIGTHEVVGSGSGFVVINIQSDVNFIGTGSDAGTPKWSIGTLGENYNNVARFYLIGGGASSNASGTVPTNGVIQNSHIVSGGAGYSGKPQVVVSGGGWRLGVNSNNDIGNIRCNYILGASSGIFIQRQKAGGQKAFIESINPFE
ncbi:MAG: hypothetical protein VX038_00005 [Verrucomicrobiota bacterium]|nr:hypothetical protein [Verrucomicrobiota bacterium]